MITVELPDDLLRTFRLRAQLLDASSRRKAGVEEVVAHMIGIQAQLPTAAALAVRPRTEGSRIRDVEVARVGERAIVRTWAMRGTLHLLASEDLGWILRLLRPAFVPSSRRRLGQLGFGDEATSEALRAIRQILATHGPLTRAELAERLRGHGANLDREPQAIYHLVHRAGLDGIVCFGPDRNGQESYALVGDWAPAESATRRERSTMLGELARRYLASYGPARPEDLAAWSGLSVRDSRVGWNQIGDRLKEVWVRDERVWTLNGEGWPAPRNDSPLIRLLPHFDAYLLGYRSRAFALRPVDAKQVQTGGGYVHPTVVADGRVVGRWRYDRGTETLAVIVEPFISGWERDPSFEKEVRDVGRFLEATGNPIVTIVA